VVNERTRRFTGDDDENSGSGPPPNAAAGRTAVDTAPIGRTAVAVVEVTAEVSVTALVFRHLDPLQVDVCDRLFDLALRLLDVPLLGDAIRRVGGGGVGTVGTANGNGTIASHVRIASPPSRSLNALGESGLAG